MQPRKNSREVVIQGAFPGADVVRGTDWNHEDKDGKDFCFMINLITIQTKLILFCVDM